MADFRPSGANERRHSEKKKWRKGATSILSCVTPPTLQHVGAHYAYSTTRRLAKVLQLQKRGQIKSACHRQENGAGGKRQQKQIKNKTKHGAWGGGARVATSHLLV